MDFLMKIKRRVRLRREGFAGQHLVALPRDVVQAHARHPLLRGLRVTDAGLFPRARGHQVERTQGAVSTLVILCTAGYGWTRLGSSPAHPVAPNDLLWLPAGRPHSYGASAERPWTIVWAHLEGDEVDFWRHHLSLPAIGGTLSLPPEKSDRVAHALEETYHFLEQGYAFPRLVEAAAWVRNALVSAAGTQAPSSKGISAEQRVTVTVDWMRDHLYRSARLPELAMLARMSIPTIRHSSAKQPAMRPLIITGVSVSCARASFSTPPILPFQKSPALLASRILTISRGYFGASWRVRRAPIVISKKVEVRKLNSRFPRITTAFSSVTFIVLKW